MVVTHLACCCHYTEVVLPSVTVVLKRRARGAYTTEFTERKGVGSMPRKAFTVEQIIIKLREIEVLCGQGKTIAEAVRQSDITEQTYYRWRKQYGGMKTDDAKRLKELEKENTRLKRLVADLSLDNAILRDVNLKNF